MQRVRTGTNTDTVFHPMGFCKPVLKVFDRLAKNELRGLHDCFDCGEYLSPQRFVLPFEVDEGDLHGGSSICVDQGFHTHVSRFDAHGYGVGS
jgi:hypothetical protein